MSTQTYQSFEVQVHSNGRWQTHARFEHDERALAVREAKDLDYENPNVAVRVILDTYDPDTGRHKETALYRNKAEISTPQRSSGKNWADATRVKYSNKGYLQNQMDLEDLFDDPFEERRRNRVKVSPTMFFAIISIILIIGVGAGGGAAAILALLVEAFDLRLAPPSYKAMLVGMFVIVFIIASLSALSSYRTKFDLNPFEKRKRKRKEQPPKATPSKISQQMAKAAKAIDNAPPVEVTTPSKADEDFDIFESLPDLTPAPDVPINEEAVPEMETQAEPEFSANAEQQRMMLMNFLGACLSALKGPEASIESLNRFGLNVFMTGAVGRLAIDNDLTQHEFNTILNEILQTMGARSEQADQFIQDYQKHLNDPRHKQLYDESGEIAAKYADGDQAAPLHAPGVVENWLNWKPTVDETVNPNLRIIMFTDMVGSTDLTTKHGDFAAQEVLKAHDLIVRAALTNLDGKEIKHLGDGIMASFKDPDKAMKAAIEIQKRVEGNNGAGPEYPLHVRIGLNAGEPIRKDNDLFGTSVQLAARLCNATASDCILISTYLLELFGDKPEYTFIDKGPQMLKGFDSPQQTYLVDWKAPPKEYPDEEIATEADVPPPITDNTAAPPLEAESDQVNPVLEAENTPATS